MENIMCIVSTVVTKLGGLKCQRGGASWTRY